LRPESISLFDSLRERSRLELEKVKEDFHRINAFVK